MNSRQDVDLILHAALQQHAHLDQQRSTLVGVLTLAGLLMLIALSAAGGLVALKQILALKTLVYLMLIAVLHVAGSAALSIYYFFKVYKRFTPVWSCVPKSIDTTTLNQCEKKSATKDDLARSIAENSITLRLGDRTILLLAGYTFMMWNAVAITVLIGVLKSMQA